MSTQKKKKTLREDETNEESARYKAEEILI